jgi:AraC family transcriptional regulator
VSGQPGAVRSGDFYGELDWASARGGFEVRALAASGREEDVDTHTHEQAHFVLVLSGVYASSARGAPRFARSPFLVFNPPGTTHRDRFAGGVGAFVTLSLTAEAANLRISDGAVSLAQGATVAAAFQIAREVRGPGADAGVVESAVWDLIADVRQPRASRAGAIPGWAHAAYETVSFCVGGAPRRRPACSCTRVFRRRRSPRPSGSSTRAT